MVPEEILDLVVDMIWYQELQELVKYRFMAYAIELKGEIHCINYDIWVRFEEDW